MKKLLTWTNGRKTFIGLAVYFAIGGFKQIGVLDEAQANQLVLAAEVLVGAGVLHKIKKSI